MLAHDLLVGSLKCFPFPEPVDLPRLESSSYPPILPIAGNRRDGFMLSPRILVQSEPLTHLKVHVKMYLFMHTSLELHE